MLTLEEWFCSENDFCSDISKEDYHVLGGAVWHSKSNSMMLLSCRSRVRECFQAPPYRRVFATRVQSIASSRDSGITITALALAALRSDLDKSMRGCDISSDSKTKSSFSFHLLSRYRILTLFLRLVCTSMAHIIHRNTSKHGIEQALTVRIPVRRR